MLKAHYDILGIDKNSSKSEVKKAYREKSRQFHPDKGGTAEMMGLLNSARDSILAHLDTSDSSLNINDNDISEEDITEVLSTLMTEDLDDPEKRLSKKYAIQHTELIQHYKKQNNIEIIQGIAFFDQFKSNLYCEIKMEENDLRIDEYTDLFDLITKKENNLENAEDLSDADLQNLDPQNAVLHLIKYVEGKYFGDVLTKLQAAFKSKTIKFSNLSEYNLYTGIFEIITTKEIVVGKEGDLLRSLNKVTDFIRAKTVNIVAPMSDYLASLLQNLYFRTLFTQAVHLFWVEQSRNFNPNDRKDLSSISVTRKYYLNLASQLVLNHREGRKDDALLNNTILLKRLCEFEEFSNLGANQDNSPDWSRQRGYETLNWLYRLIPYANRSILINVLIQAGTYFQEASISARQDDKFVAKADQKIAFNAYMEANALASHSSPDLEIYTITNILKFVSSFKYQDYDIAEVVKDLQKRLLYLVDIFPVYSGLQPSINLITQKDESNLSLMRGFLHSLVKMSNNNELIDHDRLTVLYQAYEASVKNWYQQNYDPESENRFRLELMDLLLKDNNWSYSELDKHLVSSVMIKRDNNGWFDMIKPLRVANCGLQTYSSLDGVEINSKTGEIKFVLDDGSFHNAPRKRQNTFTIYDLMEMLEKNVTGANFSLDPVDPNMMYHPFNAMRFAPADIYRTQFLNTMLLADYVLKFLTIGEEVQGKYPYDMRSINKMIDHLPKSLKEIIENFHFSQNHKQGSIHRFWIEAEQLSIAAQESEEGISKFAVSDLKMVVKKHTMERDAQGNLVDTQKDDEGWDLYILNSQQKKSFDEGNIIIKDPSMIVVDGSNQVYFVESGHIFKEDKLSPIHIKDITILAKQHKDLSGKITVTTDNEMLIYRLISGIAAVSEVPNRFSPEYIFAQEFTDNYDKFSQYLPIFARLKELSKMTLIIRHLNNKKEEAEQKKEHYFRLLLELPDWEQRDQHPSIRPNYFAKPVTGSILNKQDEEQATFRYNNANKIIPLLPYTLYNKNFAKTAKLYSTVVAHCPLNINSPEINKRCSDLYCSEQNRITREGGEAAWNYNKNGIWQQICDQKPRMVNDINAARYNVVKDFLYNVFITALPELPQQTIDLFINQAWWHGDFRGFAVELTRKEIEETKKQIRHMLHEQARVLDAFKDIGLGREENKDCDLDGKCLWVPASVKHHVASNTSLFIYGGVRVMPKANVLNSSDARFNQTINNAFNSQGKSTANNASISAANNRMNSSSSQGGSSSSQSGGGPRQSASAHDRLQFEKMRTEYRQQANWRNPVEIKNDRLRNLADGMYRANAQIGSGSTADAVRVESANHGARVGGNLHAQKAREAVITITKLLNSSTLSSHDTMIAENMRLDLLDSLGNRLWYSQTSTPNY